MDWELNTLDQLLSFLQLDAHEPGDAPLFHGDAIEGVRSHHGGLLVGDNDANVSKVWR